MELFEYIKSYSTKNRPDWDSYFMSIAYLTSLRSNCIKRKVGCIIVKNNRVLSQGYNGTPSALKNCFDGGCKRCSDNSSAGTNLDLCLCLHAEENALLYISQSDLFGSTLYSTLIPCLGCTKKIIQCGISKVYFHDLYNPVIDANTLELCKTANVFIQQLT
jgi:dCMP deaminase